MIYVLVLEKKDVSLLILKCKQLTINSWISKKAILGIDALLRSTPYLENLTILHEEVCFQLISCFEIPFIFFFTLKFFPLCLFHLVRGNDVSFYRFHPLSFQYHILRRNIALDVKMFYV